MSLRSFWDVFQAYAVPLIFKNLDASTTIEKYAQVFLVSSLQVYDQYVGKSINDLNTRAGTPLQCCRASAKRFCFTSIPSKSQPAKRGNHVGVYLLFDVCARMDPDTVACDVPSTGFGKGNRIVLSTTY